MRFGFFKQRGRVPVPIDQIVSPLRYDIVVRQQFFELAIANRSEVAGDLPAFVRRATRHPYFAWFREIVFPRSGVGGIDIEAAFAERVRHACALLDSFESVGFDRSNPIVLRTAGRIEPTVTGKRIDRRIFAGDGCHRIALLRLEGCNVLAPDMYVLRRMRRYEPLDNTARLLGVIAIGTTEYYEFLSLAYGGGRVAHDKRELLEFATAAGRRREAEGVIAIDEPLLAGSR